MYVICEWDSIAKNNSAFQRSLANLETQVINKCNVEWAPRRFNAVKALSPDEGGYGRTTILPALFADGAGTALDTTSGGGDPDGTWRLLLTTAGNQTLLQGASTGSTISEDFKIAWAGLAFPNKNEHISEIKFQIGDRKYGRIDLEVMLSYNKPAIIFEEGFLLDEETSFHLYGYVEGPIPVAHDQYTGVHQRIVMLGAAYFKVISKVLGNCAAPI